FHDIPKTDPSYRPDTSTRVFAWDGTLIGEYSTERRVYVPYEQIPPQLISAFLAAEDRDFYKHGAIDVQGMSRALAKDVYNVAAGRRLEGGSTITQQVAKNILLTNESTFGRKIKEAVLSVQLERQMPKQHILELYLNEIFLGYRSNGVAIAAYNYFGKSLNQLTLPEMAYLAALPKGPNNYDPRDHKGLAIARRNWILDQMVQTGAISRRQANEAKRADLIAQPGPTRAAYSYADFFVEEVRRQAQDRFGDKLNRGGYYIRTTLDAGLQENARNALMAGLERYDRRHGWRGATRHVDPPADWRPRARTMMPPSERTGWRSALVESINGNYIRITPVSDDAAPGFLAPEDVTWARAGKGLAVGDIVFVELNDVGRYRLRQIPAVNGAMVAVDPHTGRVVAMVGGYSFSISKFNRATQAQRQPGSSFKPFVYATALENDFTPASVILDGPITLKGANGEDWTPENYAHDFLGPLVMRKGLELSRNTMTVRLAQATGMKKVADNAVKFGIVDHMEPVLAMALGAGETTPLRLAGAYSIFI
ncbi:MAG: transglycosylase domain-containing protein, partial [Alphaproteobacteria bacterium]